MRDACRRLLSGVETHQLQKRQEQEEPDALREGEARCECSGQCHLCALIIPERGQVTPKVPVLYIQR